MTAIRNISPPSLPIPTADYTVIHQNILAATLQQFGTRTSNAVNQLLTNTQTPVYNVATLPKAASNLGKLAYVPDGLASLIWGDIVVGGGVAKYLVWSNGVDWTVVGK